MRQMCPQWLDLTGGKPLKEAVIELFAITSATEYVVSDADYVAAGWQGERCRLQLGPGFVTVHADQMCPPGALWARPSTGPTPVQRELESFKQAFIAWINDAIARARR